MEILKIQKCGNDKIQKFCNENTVCIMGALLAYMFLYNFSVYFVEMSLYAFNVYVAC